ncbi:uncharacterized protein LOC128411592 [Podarcis raffonei]|uniref:uncharacterized protein LOC128411592 n=1 Tax=Podarcis raffonei TaxID=65483 RepID=UPI0023295E04|nr:uncharacterized protein LOC128411592 [Podarcis raffonei]
MEPFSLYDITAVVYTKSTERIISPMVAELYHLIIAVQWGEVNREGLAGLQEAAEELAKATGQLSSTARRLAEESDDEVLKREMAPAAESLLISGENILLVAQKLLIQPDAENCLEELAASAKRILMETIKVLQAEDDALVRKIIQAAHWLFNCLLVLEPAEDVSAMLVIFRSFSEALLLLTKLTERLLWDLKESCQKHLAQTLQLLKNCIPMLYTAKLSSLKHPGNEQVEVSKSYIFGLARSTVKELISQLRNKVGTKKLHERTGLFPHHLHNVLSLLSRPQSNEGEISFLVESLVFYCMLLADSSRGPVKLNLVQHCHRLLKFRKMIATNEGTLEGFPVENQRGGSIEEKCSAMRAEMENLDQAVRTAVLYQVLDNFVETKGPMKRLVEAAMQPCSPAENGGFLRKLKPLTTEFFNHSNQMLKATNFVLVTCTERKTIQSIEGCVDHLSRLLATVPALLSEMSHPPGRKGAPEKLHFLCQTWLSTTESLLICLDKVIDLREFLKLCLQDMVEHKARSEKALEEQQSGEFSQQASSLSKRAVQVVEFISRHLDRARDPIFRNGLLVLIKQLENAIPQVKVAADQCLARMASLQAKDEYSKRAKDLMEAACNVRLGLDECNQPDILSPLRVGVRSGIIFKDVPDCFTPQDLIELDTQSTTKQSSSNNSELLEELSGRSIPVYSSSSPNPSGSDLFSEGASGKIDMHTLISEILAATKTHNVTSLNSACSDLLELSSCWVDAAKEALQVSKLPVSEELLQYREIVTLIPCLISSAREVDSNSIPCTETLQQTAVLLSERIDAVKQGLTIVASSWYSLARQLICVRSSPEFSDNAKVLGEIMEILQAVVQLAGKATRIEHDEGLPELPGLHETFLRVQAKLICVQARTKLLLEKALAVNQPRSSNKAELETMDAHCLLWSVTIQAFLNSVDQFIGRDVLSLTELQAKTKHPLCLQSSLAAVSESSLRIQEASRLSLLSCAEHSAKHEVTALKEQMKILTYSLLGVADVLTASPLPAPNLLVRFELLQRELAITAKVLLLQMSVINGEYLSSIRSIISRAQPVPRDKEAFEKHADELRANIQMVKKTIGDALESLSSEELRGNLLSTADCLLLLTDEVIRRAGELQSQLDKEHLLGDSVLYEWSATAAYLVKQLQSVKGAGEAVVEHVRRCLQNKEGHMPSSQSVCQLQPPLPKELCSAKDQSPGTPKHKATKTGQGVLLARDVTKTPREDPQSGFKLSHSERNLKASPATSPGDSEKSGHDGCPIAQVTQQMTTQMSYMAKFLKRKGPITTKEQLISCAAQIISGGEALVKFAGIIAKNCLDERCATELLYAMEQTKTISYQLSIVSRVNASTGKSRSSAEHLVRNAQNLIQVALQMLKAAEVACVKGLRQPAPNSEEANVAAFCSRWRKSLWWHRAKEALNSDRDELGLRKKGSWTEPTFTSMTQELSAP